MSFKKINENAFDYLFIVLVLVLPFSLSVPNIILGILILCFLVNLKTLKPLAATKSNSLMLLFSFFAYLFLKAIINNTLIIDSGLYSRYLIVIIIPILFFKIIDIAKIKIAIIIAVSALIIKSIYMIGRFYLVYHNFPLGDGNMANSLLAIERPYAGFMAVVSVLLSLEQIQEQHKHKSIFWFPAALGVFFILFVSARNSFLTLFFLSALYLLCYLRTSLKKKMLLITIVLVAITITIGLNKNLQQRLHVNESFEKTLAELSANEPRAIIWPCTYMLSQQMDFNYFFGFKSENEIRNKLKDCYGTAIPNNESKRKWFLDEGFNTHNQFIDAYLLGGIVGFLLLLYFLVYTITQVKNNFFAVSIFLSVIFFFAFENCLHRQLGCYIFAIIFAIYNKKGNYEIKNKIPNSLE